MLRPEDRAQADQFDKKLEEIRQTLTESYRAQGDLIVTLTHGLDSYSAEFVYQLETRIDSALVPMGFARMDISISREQVRLVYRQFARAL